MSKEPEVFFSQFITNIFMVQAKMDQYPWKLSISVRFFTEVIFKERKPLEPLL